MPSATQATPLPVRAAQAWLSMLGAVAPSVAGRSAADLFTRTRPSKPVGDARSAGGRAMPLEGLVKEAHVFGDGASTVLLVHGWASDESSLFGLAQELVKQGLRVVTFDAPAHGRAPGAKTTLAEFSRAVGEILDAVGPVEAIVAHSLGGLAALGAVSASPSRKPRRMAFIAAPVSMVSVFDAFCAFMRFAPPLVESTRAALEERNGMPMDYWNAATLGKDLPIPALVLHDRDDVFVPFGHAERMLSTLESARLEATSGLGHRRIVGDLGVHRRIAAFLRAN